MVRNHKFLSNHRSMVRNPAAPGNAARQPGTYVDPMIDSDAYSIYIQRDTLLDSLCYSIEIDDEVLDALDNRFLCPDGIAQPDVWVYEFKGTHLSIVQDICVVIEDVYDRFKCGGRPFRLHTCLFINAAVSTAIGEVHAKVALKAEARRAARAKRNATVRVNDMTAKLYDACCSNNLTAATQALRSGADMNRDDGYGFTPLDIALQFGHQKMAALLRAAGATSGDEKVDQNTDSTAEIGGIQCEVEVRKKRAARHVPEGGMPDEIKWVMYTPTPALQTQTTQKKSPVCSEHIYIYSYHEH